MYGFSIGYIGENINFGKTNPNNISDVFLYILGYSKVFLIPKFKCTLHLWSTVHALQLLLTVLQFASICLVTEVRVYSYDLLRPPTSDSVHQCIAMTLSFAIILTSKSIHIILTMVAQEEVHEQADIYSVIHIVTKRWRDLL